MRLGVDAGRRCLGLAPGDLRLSQRFAFDQSGFAPRFRVQTGADLRNLALKRRAPLLSFGSHCGKELRAGAQRDAQCEELDTSIGEPSPGNGEELDLQRRGTADPGRLKIDCG